MLYCTLVTLYLAMFTLYWLWTVAHFASGLRPMLEVRHMFNNLLGVSEQQVQVMKWSEVAHR